MDTPSIAQMRVSLGKQTNPDLMDNIGVNEALDLNPKVFMNPNPHSQGIPDVGGVQSKNGLPIGGVDAQPEMPGQQLMPAQGGLPSQPMQSQQPQPSGPTPPEGNMLSMTPQGQAMNAMKPPMPQQPQAQGLAEGGQPKPKRTFAIMPVTAGAVKTPEGFTPYDAAHPSIKSLATAFDEAIQHHLSLSPEDRKANSIRAAEMVSNHIGRTENKKPKDLLGKNAKLIKSEKGGEEAVKLPDGRGIETTGLALSPAFQQGQFHTCPNSASCKDECLGKTSGNYFKLGGGPDLSAFKGPRLNSLMKTLAMINDPHSFAVKLYDEISDAKAIAAQNNNHLGLRLNVLSDINPRVHRAIINGHPDVSFYDYTKNNTNPIAPNHHYTYSSTGVSQKDVENPNSNWTQMRKRLEMGDNVAMAFTNKNHLPTHIVDEETGKKYKVVDGDSHDFRPLDMQPEGEDGVIIGLKNKKAPGKVDESHIDSNGFFVHYDPKELKNPNGTYTRTPSTKVSKKSGKPLLGDTIPTNREVRIQPQKPAKREKSNDEGFIE
jgi:hypothetical protein